MTRDSFGFFGLALVLAACSQSADVPAAEAESAEDGAQQALTPVDTPDSASIEAPALAPVSRAELEAELEAGAGCSLEEDGKLLLVAVDGDAIARPHGTLRHFTFDGDLDALWEGGTFTAGVISVTIERGEGEGEQIEGVTAWPAIATIAEEGQDGSAVYEDVTWECGA